MYSVNSTQTATQADTSVNAANYASEAKQVQPVADRTTAQKSAPKEEDINAAVNDLNKTLDSLNVNREFSVDKSTDDIVVKIVDKDTKQVIRQIPSEDTIKMSKNIREMVGLLYDSTS